MKIFVPRAIYDEIAKHNAIHYPPFHDSSQPSPPPLPPYPSSILPLPGVDLVEHLRELDQRFGNGRGIIIVS